MPSLISPDSEYSGWLRFFPERTRDFLSLARFDRPIGWQLLYWPCLWGLCLGGSLKTHWPLLFAMLLGAIVMRGAGCVYNDIIDRELDAQVERTRSRPLASGAVSVKAAWLWIALLLLLGLMSWLLLPPFAKLIALASILLVAAYPFMKRITWWPQAWLGMVFSWGALVGGAVATHPHWEIIAPLYLGSIFWVIGYDTIYACQDMEDDALAGIRSSARAMGAYVRQGVGLCFALAILLWAMAFWLAHPASLHPLCLAPVAAHMLWQISALNPNNPKTCLKLFRANNSTGMLMALACLVSSLF
jgi:4-hydroxybenzoate polyprenyltransferase